MNLTPKHYHQRSKHHKEQATQISYHLDVFSSVILEGVNEKPAKAGPCTLILIVVTQYYTSLESRKAVSHCVVVDPQSYCICLNHSEFVLNNYNTTELNKKFQ